MPAGAARITYLYHSGFAVETDEQLIIFDYCLNTLVNDERRQLTSGVVSLGDLLSKPSVHVFASHGHNDHFNASILRWSHKRKDITYVLSDDITIGKSAIHLAANNSVSIPGMKISTFPSTDVGVSFLVETENLSIFHAGDLNLWHGHKGDLDTEEDRFAFRKAKFAFSRALESIRGKHIDITFFPVDPRIGIGYDTGAIYFARLLKPKLFVPMHFGESYDICETFSSRVNVPGMKVFCISARGQQFEYRQGEV